MYKMNLINEFPSAMFSLPEANRLHITAVSTSAAQASQWASEDQMGPAQLVVHPNAAEGHGDGDVVELRSEHGKMEVELKLDANQRADIALLDKGGWYHRGRCANDLITAELTDDGECAVYYDTTAEIFAASDRVLDRVGPSPEESATPSS